MLCPWTSLRGLCFALLSRSTSAISYCVGALKLEGCSSVRDPSKGRTPAARGGLGTLPSREGLSWLPLLVLCKPGLARGSSSRCVSTPSAVWQQWVPGLCAGRLWVLLLSFLPTSLWETCPSHSHGEPDPYTTMTGTRCWNEVGGFFTSL